jgi:hypothetical protein
MKPACPIPGNFTASQTLYQNRLPRFYGDLWGVLICLQHPGRRASLVFRPLLLRGGWSLSAGFNPAHHRVLYIPLAFATWACGCITRGARHNPPSQCHTWLAVFPSALPTKALAIVRSTVGVRQKKAAKVMHPVRTPSGQRERAHALAAYLSVLTPTGRILRQSFEWCQA